jgi:hypothetical protein
MYGVVASLFSRTNLILTLLLALKAHLLNLQNTRQREVEYSESSSPCCLATFFVSERLANRHLAPGRIEAANEKKKTNYDDLFVKGRKTS